MLSATVMWPTFSDSTARPIASAVLIAATTLYAALPVEARALLEDLIFDDITFPEKEPNLDAACRTRWLLRSALGG